MYEKDIEDHIRKIEETELQLSWLDQERALKNSAYEIQMKGASLIEDKATFIYETTPEWTEQKLKEWDYMFKKNKQQDDNQRVIFIDTLKQLNASLDEIKKKAEEDAKEEVESKPTPMVEVAK